MLKPPPKQIRGHETKLHILQTAAKLYVVDQHGHVSMSQIAQAANVSHGATYRYFVNLPDLWHFAAENCLSKAQELSDQIFGVEVRDPRDLLDKWARLYLALSNLRREYQGMLTMGRLHIFGTNSMHYLSLLCNQLEYWRLPIRQVLVQSGATKDEQEVLLSWIVEQFLCHVFLAPILSDTANSRIETLRCADKIQWLFSFKNIS
jgi:AcrR family transcriptional regulator